MDGVGGSIESITVDGVTHRMAGGGFIVDRTPPGGRRIESRMPPSVTMTVPVDLDDLEALAEVIRRDVVHLNMLVIHPDNWPRVRHLWRMANQWRWGQMRGRRKRAGHRGWF